MKIIDLLNKIAKGEEVPQNIKYNDLIWFWCEGCQIYETNNEDGKCINLYSGFTTEGNLNDEVENLEEVEDKKYEYIEELTDDDIYFYPECEDDSKENFEDKINALIRNQKYIKERLEDIQKIKNKRFTRNQKQIASKINELIDVVNEIRNRE